MLLISAPMAAADAAFDVVFGIFLAALAVLAVVTLRWAVRRDRAGRAGWLARQRERASRTEHGQGTHGRR